jgi:hypothetical protein
MPDHRARDGSSGTANDRAFHGITGYGGTNCRSAQTTDCSALLGARACCERNDKAQYEQCLFHELSSSGPTLSPVINARFVFSIHRFAKLAFDCASHLQRGQKRKTTYWLKHGLLGASVRRGKPSHLEKAAWALEH